VYKDVELQQHNEEPVRRKWRPRRKAKAPDATSAPTSNSE
jgi:hypothetical protein